MTINILIDQSIEAEINTKILDQAVRITLELAGRSDVEVSVKITNDDEMRQLNKTYRGIEDTTDVLSFNQEYIDPQTHQLYLGDIVISIDKARSQALENQHPLNKECALLVIHGTLHLLGYDHDEPKDKDEMWHKQEELLTMLMLSNTEDFE